MPLQAIAEIPTLDTHGKTLASLMNDVVRDVILYMDRIPPELRDARIPGQHSVRLLLWHMARLMDAGVHVIMVPPPVGEALDLRELAQRQIWYRRGYHQSYCYDPFGRGNGLGYMTSYTIEEVLEIPCMSWEDLTSYFECSAAAFCETVLSCDLYVLQVGFPPFDGTTPAINGAFVIIEDVARHFGTIEMTLSYAEENLPLEIRCLPHIERFHRFLRRFAFDPNMRSRGRREFVPE